MKNIFKIAIFVLIFAIIYILIPCKVEPGVLKVFRVKGKCKVSECKPDFKLTDNKCVPIKKSASQPSPPPPVLCESKVKLTNVKTYKINDKSECVPYECETGFILDNDDKNCILPPISEETLKLVTNTLNTEIAKPGRVFVSSADIDKDFDIQAVAGKLIQAGCTTSTIAQCVTDFVNYCDNNPNSLKFNLDCDQIVGNLGNSCKNDSECQAPKKCKVTPDSFKLFCN